MFNPMQSAPRIGCKPDESLVKKVLAHSGNFLLDWVDLGLARAVGTVRMNASDYYHDSLLFDIDFFETTTKSYQIEINSYR
jgi:hypothetical protein